MNGSKYVVMVNNAIMIDSAVINKSVIYLRAVASNTTSKASFAYSFDNNVFTPFGNE